MSSVKARVVTWDPKVVTELARRYGTPLYVYQQSVMSAQFERLSRVLAPLSPLICYAMKANSNLSILKHFYSLGAGFDIVSGGELKKVLAACSDASRVVFAGVAKTRDEIAAALQARIKFFNVESPAELAAIESVAAEMGQVANVALRINPDVEAKTHHHLTTGTKANKFGMSIADAFQAWQEKRNSLWLSFVGLDCHIGSQITDYAPLEAAYTKTLEVVEEFRGRGAKFHTLDLGGGLGISYSGHYPTLDLEGFGAMVCRIFQKSDLSLVFEPGRFLIAEAGALVSKVLYRKRTQDKSFLIVDAGMNDLMRPAMYDSYHAIEVLGRDGALEFVDVVGPVCESSCFLAKDRELPRAEQGDLILVRDAGAYGIAMSSTYNVRPQPAEVLIESNAGTRQIRRREAVEELWRCEIGE